MRVYTLEMYTPEWKKQYCCTGCQCDCSASSNKDLERHFLTHASRKPHLCSAHGCGYAAWKLEIVVSHMKTHVYGNELWKRYRCNVSGCGFKGVHHHASTAHMLSMHACKDTLRCKVPGCDHAALSYSMLKSHMQKHVVVLSNSDA